MSLARAFTTRRQAKTPQLSDPVLQRAFTTKRYAPGTIRHKISAPIELLSTTNMLSYNAPDLFPVPSLSSSSSSKSISDSEHETTSPITPPTSPDSSSIEESADDLPIDNHLSCYFKTDRQSTSSAEDSSAPVIPERSPSHTKRSHEMLHRKRSISRMSTQSKNSVKSFARDSLQMFGPTPETTPVEVTVQEVEDVPARPLRISFDGVNPKPQHSVYEPPRSRSRPRTSNQAAHPFGAELAQVTELAEEYGLAAEVRIVDEEEQELIKLGLFKYSAQEYMNDIEGLFRGAFGETQGLATMWI